MRDRLISHRFAIVVLSIFLGASAGGWLITEFIPPNFPARRAMFREMWGGTAVRMIDFFRLYDPFHSFWYRAVLALFFITLLLCTLTRWKGFILRSFRIDPPAGSLDLGGKKLRFEIGCSNVAEKPRSIFESMAALLRKKGYYVAAGGGSEEVLFTAVAGRWRFFGEFLFHAGLVVLVLGGMIGSFWGSTEMLYGKAGEVLPLHDSPYSLLVKDFEILMTERDELFNYRSRACILGSGGDTLKTGEIRVNSPLSFAGFTVYQSTYYAAENDFESAHIEFIIAGDIRQRRIAVSPGKKFELDGTPYTLEAKRFFPDFRMNEAGPHSASLTMANPALEIAVRGPQAADRGWLFLAYPQFNSRFDVPLRFNLLSVEPVYYTGLQISTSPGTKTILAGIMLATVGLILLYTISYRSIIGLVGGGRIVLAGVRYTWKVSFENEFKYLEKALRREFADTRTKEGNVS